MKSREDHPGLPKTGIMADSHGDAGAIEAAARFLKKLGCGPLFHLGDICDSLRPETAGPCVERVRARNIRAVKGNNDHILALNMKGRLRPGEPPGVVEYLNALPQTLTFHHAVFCHSLPFEREMGASAMTGILGPGEAARFFKRRPGAILFRGHSHAPGVLFQKDGVVREKSISQGRETDLKEKIPCVVTCGALSQGLCMVWHPGENRLSCHAFA